jgi:transposase-like protein
MKKSPDPHYRHRFPAEIISHAVWLYHVFSLSLRDVELILAQRRAPRAVLVSAAARKRSKKLMNPSSLISPEAIANSL